MEKQRIKRSELWPCAGSDQILRGLSERKEIVCTSGHCKLAVYLSPPARNHRRILSSSHLK
uniref:Uncharacterized protein n=1 Tax=Arundo donax TaxID=35708 RepID=A0A0A8XY15_ARUDO